MNRIPFSVYDFFGYLAAGFLLLASADVAFGAGAVLNGQVGGPFIGAFWVLVAYVVGHILANISGYSSRQPL